METFIFVSVGIVEAVFFRVGRVKAKKRKILQNGFGQLAGVREGVKSYLPILGERFLNILFI